MRKQESKKPKEDREQKTRNVPDTGQGSAGDFGSDADVGESGSGTDAKKKDNHDSPIPIPVKRKDKKDSNSRSQGSIETSPIFYSVQTRSNCWHTFRKPFLNNRAFI